MKLFKIKYINTKGITKTRSIKALTQEKAQSKIKDFSQHVYTLTEDIGVTVVGEKTLNRDMRSVMDGLLKKAQIDRSSYKAELLNKYASAFSSFQVTYNVQMPSITSSLNIPIKIMPVSASTTQQFSSEDSGASKE